MNRILSFLAAFSLCTYLWHPVLPETLSAGDLNTNAEVVEAAAQTPQFDLTAPSALLMEASTGTVIYEQQADERRSPASITKIMTLILIFDALKDGTITLEEEVVTSQYAKSMGGSQVFLEEGEKQTVDTMIKCIVVASANDASVAMAERIAGSEAEFVNRMNERAAGLGMENTHFEDCCGLTDSDQHYSSARDVAIMSRELITKYPAIHEYATIWMQNITHTTDKGTTEFGLANTNKLLKQYQWATGLKTGSTSKAKYCVSATAEKDGIKMIAVIMACPNYKDRFSEAATLLNYGYATCKLFEDQNPPALPPVSVQDGAEVQVQTQYGTPFYYLSTSGEDFSAIEREFIWEEELTAPIEKGQQVGRLEYRLNGKVLGFTPILAKESLKKAGLLDYIKKIGQQFLLFSS